MYFPCLRPDVRHFSKEPVQKVSQALGAKTLTETGLSLCLGHLRGQNVYFEKIISTYFKFKCHIIEFFLNFDFLIYGFKILYFICIFGFLITLSYLLICFE